MHDTTLRAGKDRTRATEKERTVQFAMGWSPRSGQDTLNMTGQDRALQMRQVSTGHSGQDRGVQHRVLNADGTGQNRRGLERKECCQSHQIKQKEARQTKTKQRM